MGRMQTWAIRAGYVAAAVIWALLLFTPWQLSRIEQLVLTGSIGLQLWLIGQLARRRARREHAWLQGYFAAMEDLAPDEAERP